MHLKHKNSGQQSKASSLVKFIGKTLGSHICTIMPIESSAAEEFSETPVCRIRGVAIPTAMTHPTKLLISASRTMIPD